MRRYAHALNVTVIFAEELVSPHLHAEARDSKPFTMADAYQAADLVTYPSTYEGFGNAFLEAVYFKMPIFCNRYAIYRTDIEPCGFDVVLMDGFLTDEVVGRVRRLLEDEPARRGMAEQNYDEATRFFSYRRAEDELRALLAKPRLAPPLEGESPDWI